MMAMITRPGSGQDPDRAEGVALSLRRPGWLFGLVGVVTVYAVGLFCVTLAAMALQGADWHVAAGLSTPAGVAAGLTALELGPRLRRADLHAFRDVALRGARAWGAVGAAWPLAWAIGAVLDGAPGDLGLEALRVLFGLAIGALAGAAGAAAAGGVVLVRAWPKAATDWTPPDPGATAPPQARPSAPHAPGPAETAPPAPPHRAQGSPPSPPPPSAPPP